jgi:hypothetical protein
MIVTNFSIAQPQQFTGFTGEVVKIQSLDVRSEPGRIINFNISEERVATYETPVLALRRMRTLVGCSEKAILGIHPFLLRFSYAHG